MVFRHFHIYPNKAYTHFNYIVINLIFFFTLFLSPPKIIIANKKPIVTEWAKFRYKQQATKKNNIEEEQKPKRVVYSVRNLVVI